MKQSKNLLPVVLFATTLALSQLAQCQQGPACSNRAPAGWCASVPSTTPTCDGCDKVFSVQSYQGKNRCLDYTPDKTGSPIFINDCSKSHPITVEEEAGGKHIVTLHAGNNVIGIKTTPVLRGNIAPTSQQEESPLLLEGWNSINGYPINENFFFVLDGDSIILASDRTMVAKVHNARGAIGSPVVMGSRQMADNEFWDFVPAANSAPDPTTGFVRVGYDGDPYCADPSMCTCRFLNVVAAADEGSVVKVGRSIDLTDCGQVQVKQGVTIRGERRGTQIAPQLLSCYVVDSVRKCNTSTTKAPEISSMLTLEEGGNDIRVTGLALHGPSRSTDTNQTKAIGVTTSEGNSRNIIDNNDISDWPYVAVRVQGKDSLSNPPPCRVNEASDPQSRTTSAFIARNFIHHNMQQEAGYGVESYVGGYPLIFGNAFTSNRHAIAAGFGTANTGYRAWDNLVLSAAPLQHDIFHTQDFDMHGMGKGFWLFPNGYGGMGGDYMDIYQNTFLGTNRDNFELRGDPCNYAEFHDNISLESEGDAVSWTTCNYYFCGWRPSGPPNEFRIASNPDQFNHSNPVSGPKALGVGDFDGDGADDLFLATGEAWYYSPAGNAEWRFLSAKTENIGELLFGDFDGDGRTDVVALHDGQFVVSWGGISDWEVLNSKPVDGKESITIGSTSQMAVGDFDNDKISDIFWADGKTFWVSYGGTEPFKEIATSGFAMSELRLGDFNGDGRTDVFSVGSKNWQVSYSPSVGRGLSSTWQSLRKKLSDDAHLLVVADFDGDGVADVATDCGDPGCWQISYGGQAGWKKVSQPVTLRGDLAGIGHFLGGKSTDVLTWNTSTTTGFGFFPQRSAKCDPSHGQDTQLCISAAASARAIHYSPQDMR
jgi:hypothetical protein